MSFKDPICINCHKVRYTREVIVSKKKVPLPMNLVRCAKTTKLMEQTDTCDSFDSRDNHRVSSGFYDE
jgi:hypothetical protein